MRLVFAGTPGGRRARPGRRSPRPRHELVAVVTRPDAPAGRGRRLVRSPVGALGRRARRSRCSPRPGPGSRSSCERLRELAPDCVPVVAYGALVPPVGAGDPPARLGQPALLAAARLARRGARAARGAARRRADRRQRVPAGGGPGHRPGVRHADRGDRPARHLRRPAGPARRRRRAGCWSRSSTRIEAGTARAVAAAGRRGQPRAEAHRRGRPGALGRPGLRGGPADPGLHPGARRVDDVPRRAGQARPGHAASPTAAALHAGRAAGGASPRAGRHRPPSRSRWARCARPARRRCRRRLGPRRARRAGERPRASRPSRPIERGRARRDRARRGAGDDRPRPGRRRERGGRPVDPARMAAYEAVAAVHRDDAYANLVLPRLLREHGLHGRDAAFATELTYGTLRAARHARRDHRRRRPAGTVERIDPPARDALRLGRVPAAAHAGAGARGGRRPRSTWSARSPPGADRLRQRGPAPDRRAGPGRLARRSWRPTRRPTRSGTWRWPTAIRSGSCGRSPRRSAATSARPSRAARSRTTSGPPVHLCARPGRADAVELADEVGGAPGAFSPYAVYLPGGAPGDLAAIARRPGPRAGRGLPARGARAGRRRRWTGRDERWLDLCAGPGGKAGAARRARRAAGRRADRGRGRRRTGPGWSTQATRGPAGDRAHAPTAATVGADAELPEGGFDRVLVDAPCTGLGLAAPPARSRAGGGSPRDLPPLTRLQRELLAAALRAVRPGGRGGVRDVLAAPGRDPGDGDRGGPPLAGAPVEFVDARPLLPGHARPRRPARRCSCGRTGTAPTRCSSPCCAALSALGVLRPVALRRWRVISRESAHRAAGVAAERHVRTLAR